MLHEDKTQLLEQLRDTIEEMKHEQMDTADWEAILSSNLKLCEQLRSLEKRVEVLENKLTSGPPTHKAEI